MRNKIAAIFFLLAPLSLKAQTDSLQDVSTLLQLSLEELMNVKVVTASGYLQTVSEAPSTITVITAQQIAERGYEQLEDALRDVPGIDMIHVNGYVPTLIYFRGMYGAENQRALLMIDGIAENNILGSNDMAGPTYSLHHVERIEIIWGPVSAIYGANAFGGVINIITKKGEQMDGFRIEQSFGSFNTLVEKMSVGIRKSKFEFSASGMLYSTDGPRFTNRDPQYSGSYVDKAYSFNGKLSYYSKKSKTTVGYRIHKTPMGWGTYSNSPTTYLGLPPQGYGNQGVIGVLQRDIRGEKSGLINSYLKTFYLENEFKPDEKFNIISRIVYRETGQGEDSYLYVTTDGRKLIRVPVASYSNRVLGEISANYALSGRHRFSAGVQYSQDNVEAGGRQATIDFSTVYLIDGRDTVLNLHSVFMPRQYDIRHNAGGFLQYIANTDLLGKTDFTLGLRYDYNSYFGDALSPRIALVNQPAKKVTLKAQFGIAFRAPTNLEIYQVPAGSNFVLKKERIRTYEINVIYAPSEIMRLQLNGFRNELRDVIILGNLSGLSPDKNPGKINITGAETILDIALSNDISAFANFTFQYARGKNLLTGNSSKLPGVADVKGNFGITGYVADLFTASFTGNWVGPRHPQRTNPHGNIKGYFLGNITLTTNKLFKNRITASLIIRNVFNTKWLDPGFRTADGILYSTVLEQPGINGLFKIGVTL